MGWVTREELRDALEKFAGQIAEVKDTAGAKSKYRCLLCGKPKTHVAGMLVNGPEEFEEEEKPRTSVKQIHPNTTEKSRVPPPPRDVIQLLTSETSF
jgi:hypothetical protein